MKTKKMDTRYMATLAMFCGILLVMGVTGIGFIPLPVIKATTMHIPVILGAILLGPTAGAVLGGVFGLCSIWANTTSPGLLAFAFSPFMTTEGLPGVLKSLWIALGCRILLGVIAGWLWRGLKKLLKQDYLALPVTAAVSTICHTILVMGSIYLLLAQQYAQAKNVALSAVFGLVMGTVTASGIPEAIIAAVLVTVIGKALLHLMARMKNR
ncbi:MAG: ECF transporter S component [Candidatus Faecousia sp.]|nr:ECF transporter S component [Candidatus Faecousia sp.]